MIYITGDTHGDIDFYKLIIFFKRKKVSRNDYLIILGDAGILWSEKDNYIKDYSSLGLTILFIDGNHENFDMLNNYPIEIWNNAKCHKIDDYIYHIIRGEILELCGFSFLCIGGATSTDKYLRTEGKSWWSDENIKDSDIDNAINNLKKYGYDVDYVLTHCAPSQIVVTLGYEIDDDTIKLSKIESLIKYKKWYFGHYHRDKEYDKFRCIYYDFLPLKPKQ